MKKYVKYPTKWVVRNKIKSLLKRQICINEIPYYDVGQDPQQGDLQKLTEIPVILQDNKKAS
jgi:hypothetical protein